MTDSPAARLDRAVLERAASNTLREKFAGRLFDKKYDGTSDGEWGNTAMCRASSKGGVLDAPEHRALARRAAQEGTVLLVNGGDGPSYGWRPGGSGRATPSPPAAPRRGRCRGTCRTRSPARIAGRGPRTAPLPELGWTG